VGLQCRPHQLVSTFGIVVLQPGRVFVDKKDRGGVTFPLNLDFAVLLGGTSTDWSSLGFAPPVRTSTVPFSGAFVAVEQVEQFLSGRVGAAVVRNLQGVKPKAPSGETPIALSPN
jgi:hypothetical protein